MKNGLPTTITPQPDEDRLVSTLTVRELRALIRAELASRPTSGPDQWVTIEEAAKFLSVSEDFLYHNLKQFPFVKKLSKKMLRFSVNGMHRWMQSR
jgi:predicted DNA-binding transcriptional regulator AlpA